MGGWSRKWLREFVDVWGRVVGFENGCQWLKTGKNAWWGLEMQKKE